MCSSRKNPYPPHGRSSEIPRERGVLQAKILEAKYEAKMEFLGGRGEQNKKKTSVGGVWIFSGTSQSQNMVIRRNNDSFVLFYSFYCRGWFILFSIE